MNTAGVNLTLQLNGSPAPLDIISVLKRAEITVTDEGRSGFQITFETGRADKSTRGYGLPGNASLAPFSRVAVLLKFASATSVLMDGFILHQQLQPAKSPQGALFTVTGEDVSAMMDLTETFKAFPSMDEGTIASNILSNYSQYAKANVTAPPVVIQPTPTDYLPIQRATDRAYLLQLAARFGYRFYIKFGKSTSDNEAYWGPPELGGSPQPDLLVDAGPLTNTYSVKAYSDSLAPIEYFANVQDRATDQVSSIDVSTTSSTVTALSSSPALTSQTSHLKRIYELGEGRTQAEAQAWVQGAVDRSTLGVVRIDGEVDPLRYGQVLQPRSLVTMSGMGTAFDGSYYVKSVTHVLELNSYRQRFTLTREGLNS